MTHESDVLLLHRSMSADDIAAGIVAALTDGAVTADVVAVEARRHAAESESSLGRHPLEHVPELERVIEHQASQQVYSLAGVLFTTDEGLSTARVCGNFVVFTIIVTLTL